MFLLLLRYYADTWAWCTRPYFGPILVVLTRCIGNPVRGVGGLLRCMFLGPPTSHSSSVGLGWFLGVCPPNRTFKISCGEVLVAPFRAPSPKGAAFLASQLFHTLFPHLDDSSSSLKTSLRYHFSSSLSRYSLIFSPPGTQWPFSIPGCFQGEIFLFHHTGYDTQQG